jgi:hypothetical protein
MALLSQWLTTTHRLSLPILGPAQDLVLNTPIRFPASLAMGMEFLSAQMAQPLP